jgi:hypothetical protein
MDSLIDRVAAVNPARAAEFEGRADFEALALPARRRRGRVRLLALPVAAAIAAVVILPAGAPQAGEIAQRATEAMAVDQGVLYAETHATRTSTDGSSDDYGVVRTWVSPHGMRLQQVSGTSDFPAGAQEVSGGGTITRYLPDGSTTTLKGSGVPGEIFRASDLLEAAQSRSGVDLVDGGGGAYELRWRVSSGPPYFPTIEMTLWVSKDSYAPLKFTDHSWGRDYEGRPFDQTLTQVVSDFKRLDDTSENEKLVAHQG